MTGDFHNEIDLFHLLKRMSDAVIWVGKIPTKVNPDQKKNNTRRLCTILLNLVEEFEELSKDIPPHLDANQEHFLRNQQQAADAIKTLVSITLKKM